MTIASGTPLVEVRGLVKAFPIQGGVMRRTVAEVRAVDGVDLVIRKGETLGLVGESGCGKTTVGRLILRLIEPTAGSIRYDGTELTALRGAALRPWRRRMQIIFQDPYASLDPRTPIGDSIGEGLRIHGIGDAAERERRVLRMMEMVGLQHGHYRRYPHEFSGGQRQRIGIARALVLEPELVVCDEPVSALDVSIQAQVINLLRDLQRETGIAYLFISHNLALVRHIADRIAVMYLGQIVEIGTIAEFRRKLAHPYSRALFAAAPEIGRDRAAAPAVLAGDVPSPIDPPAGCRFHTRCPYAKTQCALDMPDLRQVNGRLVRCHLAF